MKSIIVHSFLIVLFCIWAVKPTQAAELNNTEYVNDLRDLELPDNILVWYQRLQGKYILSMTTGDRLWVSRCQIILVDNVLYLKTDSIVTSSYSQSTSVTVPIQFHKESRTCLIRLPIRQSELSSSFTDIKDADFVDILSGSMSAEVQMFNGNAYRTAEKNSHPTDDENNSTEWIMTYIGPIEE